MLTTRSVLAPAKRHKRRYKSTEQKLQNKLCKNRRRKTNCFSRDTLHICDNHRRETHSRHQNTETRLRIYIYIIYIYIEADIYTRTKREYVSGREWIVVRCRRTRPTSAVVLLLGGGATWRRRPRSRADRRQRPIHAHTHKLLRAAQQQRGTYVFARPHCALLQRLGRLVLALPPVEGAKVLQRRRHRRAATPDTTEVFKISLNGYENIDSNFFSKLKKVK